MNDTTFVFALILVAAALMASNRVRYDIVALLVLLALMLSGVLTVAEALAGFGSSVVIMVAGLLVVGEMLARNGVAAAVGDWILNKGGSNEARLLILIMLAAGLLGAVMSSTAVVAVFIPIVLRVAAATGNNVSRLLLPMSYAALISGMLTLIATAPNIVVHEELKLNGTDGFDFFGFTLVGICVLAVAIIYVLLAGRHLLPNRPLEGMGSTPKSIAPSYARMRTALAILIVMVLLTVFKIVPLVAAVLMAVLAAVFTRCLTMEDAYRSIHWSSIVLIAGMLPLADALDVTGGSDLIVASLVSALGDAGPHMALTLVFFLTAGLGLVLSNTASAVLVAPIAIYLAEALGVSPYPLAVAVVIAASAAYSTPVSTPVVTLVVEPGRYRFGDFLKVGVPLLFLSYLVTLGVAPLVFPFSG